MKLLFFLLLFINFLKVNAITDIAKNFSENGTKTLKNTQQDIDLEDLDLLGLDPKFLKVIQKLGKTYKEIKLREDKVIKSELMVKAASKILDDKLKNFDSLKKDLENLLKELEKRDTNLNANLVKIYENMKPKAAAGNIQILELKLASDIIKNMPHKKSSLILANMNPAIAKKITEFLANESKQFNPSK